MFERPSTNTKGKPFSIVVLKLRGEMTLDLTFSKDKQGGSDLLTFSLYQLQT